MLHWAPIFHLVYCSLGSLLEKPVSEIDQNLSMSLTPSETPSAARKASDAVPSPGENRTEPHHAPFGREAPVCAISKSTQTRTIKEGSGN
jgi:hypothetical protein